MPSDYEDSYRDLLSKIAGDRQTCRIPLSHKSNIHIFTETMIRHARSLVQMYVAELDEDLFENPKMQSTLRNFLSYPNSRLQVLFREEPNDVVLRQHPLVKYFNESYATSIEFACAVGVYATNAAKLFDVADMRMFRFEPDPDKQVSVACFLEVKTAIELSRTFDKAFRMGKPLTRPIPETPCKWSKLVSEDLI